MSRVFCPGVWNADVRVHLFNAAVHVDGPGAVLELMAVVIWRLSKFQEVKKMSLMCNHSAVQINVVKGCVN